MSAKIVTEIYPLPEWNLNKDEIHQIVTELETYYPDFEPAFERCNQAVHGWVYLKGLLSNLPRKLTQWITLRFGLNVRSFQHFLGQNP